MYKTIVAFILFLAFSVGLVAQETKDDLTRLKNGEDLNVLYRNEASFGIYVHSAIGFGIAARRGYHVTGLKKRMFELEINNFRSPKEVKNSTSFISTGNSGYFYGKLNSILLLRAGYGYQNVLYRKSDKKSVEVSLITFVGITAAFSKPVYLYVADTTNGVEKSAQRYDPAIHNQSNIIGKAPFSDGLGQTKIIPAGYAKVGLSFDYADRYDDLKAVEVGVIMDAYPVPLQMMAYNKSNNLLFSVYLKMVWGKKWF